MAKVNVHETETQLTELLARVERGEEIVITRSGKPVAKLVAHTRPSVKRTGFGSCKGQIDMSGFDEADEVIAREFGMAD